MQFLSAYPFVLTTMSNFETDCHCMCSTEAEKGLACGRASAFGESVAGDCVVAVWVSPRAIITRTHIVDVRARAFCFCHVIEWYSNYWLQWGPPPCWPPPPSCRSYVWTFLPLWTLEYGYGGRICFMPRNKFRRACKFKFNKSIE